MNQCDGCRARLPLNAAGHHYSRKTGLPEMCCTAHLYGYWTHYCPELCKTVELPGEDACPDCGDCL